MPTKPEFINLDLDISSTKDLAPLAKFLNETAYLLSHETVEETDHITVEATLGNERLTPHESVEKMLALIDSLPEPLAGLFTEADQRVFDFGFDGGYDSSPFRGELSPDLLKRIVELHISLRFTVYSHHPDEHTDDA